MVGKEPKKEYYAEVIEGMSAHEILGTKKPIEEEWLPEAIGRNKARKLAQPEDKQNLPSQQA